MLRNRFTQLSLLLLLSAVTTVAIAAPPPGKGGGNGGGGDGGDGGSDEPAISYQLTFVGDPTGVGSFGGIHIPFGGNALGEVVGRVETSDGLYKATYYSLAGAVDLTATAGFQNWPTWTTIGASDINDVGQISLIMQESGTDVYGVFRYDLFLDVLELLAFDVARYEPSINNLGDVVFARKVADGEPNVAWLYTESTQSEFAFTDQLGNSFSHTIMFPSPGQSGSQMRSDCVTAFS